MPTINKSRTARTASISETHQAQDFAFPSWHHLTVTESEHVHALGKAETRTIFKSNSRGIVAAAESPDGAGTLAISDSQNVILHQIEHGLNSSYRLRGSEGQIRCLKFSADSKTLYFTTTILNAVQAYSLARCAILDPGPLHPSLPVAFAISTQSKLLVSASQQPPVLYIQNRTLGLEPLLLQPRVSQSPVAHACFHPERENIFLLAFQDGTIAAYDATRAARRDPRTTDSSQALCKELYAFRNLHATSSRAPFRASNGTDTSPWSLVVTGASFIPKSKSRAVTVGADGCCRVIDFESRSVLCSWHVRAPITALSLLCPEETPKTLVAIGKQDGNVAIYDTSGSRKHEVMIGDSTHSPIISVEWIRGDTAVVIDLESEAPCINEACIELSVMDGTLRSKKVKSSDNKTDHQHSIPMTEKETLLQHGPQQCEHLTDTICFRPSEHDNSPALSKITQLNYMDLFSPSKPTHPSTAHPPPDSPRRHSTPRHRPRISSTTFVSNVHNDVPAQRAPPTSTSRSTAGLGDWASQSFPVAPSSMPSVTSVKSPASNGVSTDFKGRGGTGLTRTRRGSLAFFAPYLPQIKSREKHKSTNPRRQSSVDPQLAPASLSSTMQSTKHSLYPEKQTRTLDRDEDDIWLTAESEDESDESGNDRLQHPVMSMSGRRILWHSERQKRQQTFREEISHRPSIELKMSAPVAKPLGKARLRLEATNTDMPEFACVIDQSSSSAAAKAKDKSRSTSMATTTIEEEDARGRGQLEPGFAQSFHGPVSVDKYLPRRSGLAFPRSPLPPARKKSVKTAGTYNGKSHASERQNISESFEEACGACTKMQDEIQELRREIAELRRFIKGKANAH